MECLDDVDQRDSAALDADRELLGATLAGGESPPLPEFDPGFVALTQRLGDSALVSLGPDREPASVLLVKGEAGWRIRDYLAG
jgi:eukaryotic-like serine/threonine-protein kinase